ncbi:FAD-binding oxidoreductase [Microbacterium luticocti]|uniref:FAD-binding oxidoreductase n=1 Tax=Microbacterium luticocti TaxID=451764 RepID=UPI0003F733FB|nr:FAD-binding oxidoreductase [Microbacterium luticocti]
MSSEEATTPAAPEPAHTAPARPEPPHTAPDQSAPAHTAGAVPATAPARPAPAPDQPRPLAVPAPRAPLRWDVWGDGSHPTTLPPGAKAIAAALLRGRPHPLPRPAPPVLPPVRLSDDDLAALRETAEVTCDDEVRRRHLGGKSTPDLLRRRLGVTDPAPDAVALPRTHAEVAALLRVCDDRGIAVVPFGGGTSVVGGVTPCGGTDATTARVRPVLALDLSRTQALIALDETSLLATFGAGTTGPQAEELLAAHSLTLGHFPQSFEFASLGGFAATRSSGQASSGYGRFDDLVHRLRVATPVGDLDLGRAPRSAAGPDLRELILGSEGAFGVITELTVRVRRRPAATGYGAWTFPDFESGAAALRELVQRGIRPTVIRLSDATETRVNAALGGHLTRLRGCLAVATFEAETAAQAAQARERTAAVCAAHGGRDRGDEPARSWERGRFSSPGLRDALLDVGVLAETLETATTWADLPALKDAVTTALRSQLRSPVVMCHISHVYPAGASLYVTVAAAADADPLAQWARAKDAASRAVVASGATITHHHAVGRDHRPFLADEIGPLGVAVLRSVKHTLDPHGIMNPGVLIAADEAG